MVIVDDMIDTAGTLCEAAQLGVQSSGYRPGPYSTHKEYNVERFVRWYLNQLKKGTE